MTNVEDIKALVRARINAYIAANPGVPGIAFVHGDYLIEEILDDLIGNTKVKAFWDPTESLPADPQELDRYIASATGSGWTENNAYTRIGSDWLETVSRPVLWSVMSRVKTSGMERTLTVGKSSEAAHRHSRIRFQSVQIRGLRNI